MSKTGLTVVAKMKAKPGMEEQVKQEVQALVAPTRAEAGCINYDLHQSLEEKGLFLFYENWKSREDLDAHLKTPHLQAFQEKAERILAGPLEIAFYEMLSEPASK